MNKQYIALIPAYKPGDGLVFLLHSLKKLEFTIVLVDDGSGEDYASVFSQCREFATVLHHEQNRGKGRALKTGLQFILEQYGEACLVVTMDADGQHRGEDALRLRRGAEENSECVFLGSRKMDSSAPLRSRLGNGLTRFVYRLISGKRIYDTQTGLRAFDGRWIERMLQIPGERYEYEMNVLLELARENVPLKEMEIQTIYLEQNAGSHFSPVRDSLRIYKEILKFSLSSFVSFLVDYGAYTLLLCLTGRLVLSNVLARGLSSGLNFCLNRRYVFRDRTELQRAAIRYFCLAGGILLGNTLLLRLLVEAWRLPRLPAKLLTELLFFLLSWLMQRFMVFRNRTKGEKL